MIKTVCRFLYKFYRGGLKDEYDEKKLLNVEQNLKRLLLHAYYNVSYYETVFKKIGLVDNHKVDLSKFSKIPILTKGIIRQNYRGLLSKEYTSRKWYYNCSGGSTGEPIRFIQDNLYKRYSEHRDRYYCQNILGVDEKRVKKVILWGSDRDIFRETESFNRKIINWFNNIIFLNSFKMSNQDIRNYIKIINTSKPAIIRGYAGSLFELSGYAERNKLSIYTPKILVSSAETLRPEMRRTIENVFGTKCYNFYGSREVSGIAGECASGLMHMFSFWNSVEILDYNNNPVQEGQEGRVIITNLFNYSFPLIRYEIGDIAILGPKVCDCGNILPTLKKVTGRITDHFIKEDNTLVHGEYFTHLFYLKDWVKKFQVIQEDYKKIRIKLVKNKDIKIDEQKNIESKIRLVMGENCLIIWDIVDNISEQKSGKYLYTKSLLFS